MLLQISWPDGKEEDEERRAVEGGVINLGSYAEFNVKTYLLRGFCLLLFGTACKFVVLRAKKKGKCFLGRAGSQKSIVGKSETINPHVSRTKARRSRCDIHSEAYLVDSTHLPIPVFHAHERTAARKIKHE